MTNASSKRFFAPLGARPPFRRRSECSSHNQPPVCCHQWRIIGDSCTLMRRSPLSHTVLHFCALNGQMRCATVKFGDNCVESPDVLGTEHSRAALRLSWSSPIVNTICTLPG